MNKDKHTSVGASSTRPQRERIKMNLSKGNINQEYIIEEINIDKCTKARLQVLGVLKGTKVRVLNKRNNGALIVKIRGTRLGIDKEVVEAIKIAEKENSTIFQR